MSSMQGTTEADSPLRTLIDLKLRGTDHGSLLDLVAARRGVGRSWRRISTEITELTDETVSHQTLADWYPDYRDKP